MDQNNSIRLYFFQTIKAMSSLRLVKKKVWVMGHLKSGYIFHVTDTDINKIKRRFVYGIFVLKNKYTVCAHLKCV